MRFFATILATTFSFFYLVPVFEERVKNLHLKRAEDKAQLLSRYSPPAEIQGSENGHQDSYYSIFTDDGNDVYNNTDEKNDRDM